MIVGEVILMLVDQLLDIMFSLATMPSLNIAELLMQLSRHVGYKIYFSFIVFYYVPLLIVTSVASVFLSANLTQHNPPNITFILFHQALNMLTSSLRQCCQCHPYWRICLNVRSYFPNCVACIRYILY